MRRSTAADSGDREGAAEPELAEGSAARRGTSGMEPAPTGAALSAPWRRAAAVLLAAACVARLAWPSLIQFGGEEIDTVVQAWRSLNQGLALRGTRLSIGIDMPPAFYWLASIPVAFTLSPVAITLFVMAANLAGLWLLFRLVRPRLGERAAWIATLILACAPWSILLSRRLWAQELLIPLAVATYAAFFAWRARPTLARAALVGLAGALLLQIYPSAWFLVPAWLVYAWITRLRVPWRQAAVAALVAAAVWAPYAVFRAQYGFADVETYLHIRTAPSEGVLTQAHAFGRYALLALQLLGGAGFEQALGARAHALWIAHPAAWALTALSWVFLAACALAILAALVRAVGLVRAARRRELDPGGELLLFHAVLLSCTLAVHCLLRVGVIHHYALGFAPVTALLAAWGADRAAQRLGRVGARAVLAAVLLAGVGHLALWTLYLGHVAASLPGPGGRYTPDYHVTRDAVAARLAFRLDDARHGAERRRELLRLQEQEFDGSRAVLLRYTGEAGDPQLDPLRACTIEARPGATEVRMAAEPYWFELPPFDLAPGERALVRWEISSPVENMWLVFHPGRDGSGYLRRNMFEMPVARGRQVLYLPLDGDRVGTPLRVRIPALRVTIHALEVRRIGRG